MSAAVRDRVSRISVRGLSGTGAFRISALEIAAIVASLALLVWALIYYATALTPERSQLKAAQEEYELQRKGILQNSDSSAVETTPAERAQKAIDSLNSFKNDHLTSFGSGRIALINEINALVKKHGLQLTSGIDMSTASSEEAGGDTAVTPRTRGKKQGDLQNVYPNLTVRTTVFGQYDNLKSFVAELEKNKQLLLINSMSLVNQEVRVSGRGSRGGGSGGIALTITMQAFFRPEGQVSQGEAR